MWKGLYLQRGAGLRLSAERCPIVKKKWVWLPLGLVFILAVLYFLFKPAAVLNTDEIILKAEPTESNCLVFSVENNTAYKIVYSEAFHIERHCVFGWHRISIAPASYTLAACFFEPGTVQRPERSAMNTPMAYCRRVNIGWRNLKSTVKA